MFSLSPPIWEDLPQIKCQASIWDFRFSVLAGGQSGKISSKRMIRWWSNQAIWKVWVKMGIFPNFRGENKNIWNHHSDDCGRVSLPLEGSRRQRKALAQLPWNLPKTRKDQRWPRTTNSTARCSCFLNLPRECMWMPPVRHELVFCCVLPELVTPGLCKKRGLLLLCHCL